jgi:hypothetical protein
MSAPTIAHLIPAHKVIKQIKKSFSLRSPFKIRNNLKTEIFYKTEYFLMINQSVI